MFTYLAMLWNPRCSMERRAAEDTERDIAARRPLWSKHLSVPGLAVYGPESSTPEGDIHSLSEGTGVLLGVAFSRTISPQSLKPPGRASVAPLLRCEELIASRGRAAIEKLWGSYVLFVTTR